MQTDSFSAKVLQSQFQSQPSLWQLSRERLIRCLLALSASVPILVTGVILGIFIYQSFLFFQVVSIGEFFSDRQWTPLFASQQFGILVLACATLMITVVAMAVAIPIGLLAAIYLSDYAHPRTRRILKPCLESLSGIPTIVYGYFALLFMTPTLRHIIPEMGGFSALSAGIVTGILVTPIISSISEDALSSVPIEFKQGAYAMGFTKHEVLIRVVLPAAFPGIIASFTLAASRTLGESMIAYVAGGQNPRLTLNPLVPVESMTSFMIQVSLGDIPSNDLIFHALFTVGMVLFLITLFLNGLGQWLVRRSARTMSTLSIPAMEEAEPNPELQPEQIAAVHAHTLSRAPFRLFLSRRLWCNRWFARLGLCATLLGPIIFGLLMLVTFRGGFAHLDWHFLTHFASRKADRAGIYAALFGTIWMLGLTALFAFPIGIGAAIYLEEYLPDNRLNHWLEAHIANAAAVPPIIYGLLGLALFARRLSYWTGGRSILSAALMMTVIVLPLIIIAARSALRSVPEHLRQAGYAVGMTRWQVVRQITLPAAFPGVMTSLLLGLSRAIGETSPLIAIGAVAFVSYIPAPALEGLQSSFTTLPTQIFFWAASPNPGVQDNAAAAIIVLGGIVLLMNISAVLARDFYRRQR